MGGVVGGLARRSRAWRRCSHRSASPGPAAPDRRTRRCASSRRWGWERGWRGRDPYDALNGSRARALGRTPLAPPARDPAREALAGRPEPPARRPAAARTRTRSPTCSAPTRGWTPGLGIDPAPARSGRSSRLEALRCPAYPEPCWGYHFDVETRFFFYSAETPNTIATAFAGLALLDAHERLGAEPRARAGRSGAGEFFLQPDRAHRRAGRRLPRLLPRRPHADPQRQHARGERPRPPRAAHRPRRLRGRCPRGGRLRARPSARRRLLALRGGRGRRTGSTTSTPATCSTRCCAAPQASSDADAIAAWRARARATSASGSSTPTARRASPIEPLADRRPVRRAVDRDLRARVARSTGAARRRAPRARLRRSAACAAATAPSSSSATAGSSTAPPTCAGCRRRCSRRSSASTRPSGAAAQRERGDEGLDRPLQLAAPAALRADRADLEARGREVAVTYRDHAQTEELALERWPDARPSIGEPRPPGRAAKARAIGGRVRRAARAGRAARGPTSRSRTTPTPRSSPRAAAASRR